jgi:hypothetical protein
VRSGWNRWQRQAVRSGFLLVVPLLVWNAVFWPRLPEGAGGIETVLPVFEWTENVLRLFVFGLPLLLTVQPSERVRSAAWMTYSVGLLVYFVSWLPWLRGAEEGSTLLLLGPYVTPLIAFAGIATLCRSRAYAVASIAFVLVHAVLGLARGGAL